MNPIDHQAAVREALILHAESALAGGIDRLPFGRSEPSPPPPAPAAARELPGDLARLAESVAACTACPLHATRTLAVFGEGSPSADLMFVGEGPGKEEDLSGRPFVGPAGGLLDAMIAAMGLQRSEVFIANVVKCRPPGNRNPAADEIAACLHFLKKQIARISPRVIVALGTPAAKTLLKTHLGITALRGHIYNLPFDERIRVVPTFHPAYLLRNPSDKPLSWSDLKLTMRLLEEARGAPASGLEHAEPGDAGAEIADPK